MVVLFKKWQCWLGGQELKHLLRIKFHQTKAEYNLPIFVQIKKKNLFFDNNIQSLSSFKKFLAALLKISDHFCERD